MLSIYLFFPERSIEKRARLKAALSNGIRLAGEALFIRQVGARIAHILLR